MDGEKRARMKGLEGRLIDGPEEKAASDEAPPPAAPEPRVVRMDAVHPEPVRWLWRLWLPEGELAILDGDPGLGKALALDTPLPTPDGWTTMGEVQPGDLLFDECGQPCRVVAATPVMGGRPCFRLKFSDGAEVVADANHQWATVDHNSRRRTWMAEWREKRRGGPPRRSGPVPRGTTSEVITTAEIGVTLRKGDERYNHAVRVAGALDLPERELPIDPYVLGVWLGDGSSASAHLTCAYADSELLDEVRACGVAVEERVSSNANSGKYLLGSGGRTYAARQQSLQARLRAAGLLGQKHIPAAYLRASAGQRLALLQGMMDTDGWASPEGIVEFTNTRLALADGVAELARSLGWQPTLSHERATLHGVDMGPKHRVVFYPSEPVFRLRRKADRWHAPERATFGLRYIVACEAVPSVPVRCVEVGSPSHIYLATRSFVPTHNSTLTLDLAARVSRGWPMPPTPARAGSERVREPASVLLLGAEDSLSHTVRPRLDAAGADNARVYSLEGVQQGDDERPPVIPYDLELMASRIREWGVKLVVVDPLMAFLGRDFDAHKDQDIRRCLRPLSRLAGQLSITILFLRHLNKLAGGPALYRGGSSIGITGAARASLICGRDPEADRHILAMNKINLGPKPTSLAYSLETAGMGCRIVWEGEVDLRADQVLGHGGTTKAPGRPNDELQEAKRFLATLLSGGPVASTEVERQAEDELISKRTLDRAKREMGVRSRRQKGEGWVWELPDPRTTSPEQGARDDLAIFPEGEGPGEDDFDIPD